MTREEIERQLDAYDTGGYFAIGDIYPFMDSIVDAHEAQLKAKDDKLNRIEKLIDDCDGNEESCYRLHEKLDDIFDEVGEKK